MRGRADQAERVLVERDREFEVLALAAERAQSGEGSVVFVTGPAGIGKTGLLSESAARVGASGMTVLSATGSALERDYTHGVVRQLFEGQARGAGAASERVLAGPAAYAATMLLGDDPGRRHAMPVLVSKPSALR